MRGLYTIFNKELADYLISWRGIILFAVALLITVVAIYGPAGALVNIREQLSEPTQFGQTQFIFIYGGFVHKWRTVIIICVIPCITFCKII